MRIRLLAVLALAFLAFQGCATDTTKKQGAGAAMQPPAAAKAPETKGPEAAAKDNASVLPNPKDRASYAIGVDIGNTVKAQDVEVNPDLIAQGIRDVTTGARTLLSEQEVRDTLVKLSQELQTKAQEKARVAAEKAKKEGEAFLAENKKKEGVVTLPSGLQYKVVKEGTGPAPKATDTVEVNYRGALTDNTEFDSSYKRGQPASFPVDRVIPGWTEALQLMKVGSKYQLVIPPNLAYGERGMGPGIPPNAVLVFDVELLGIKEAPKESGMPAGHGGMGGGGGMPGGHGGMGGGK